MFTNDILVFKLFLGLFTFAAFSGMNYIIDGHWSVIRMMGHKKASSYSPTAPLSNRGRVLLTAWLATFVSVGTGTFFVIRQAYIDYHVTSPADLTYATGYIIYFVFLPLFLFFFNFWPHVFEGYSDHHGVVTSTNRNAAGAILTVGFAFLLIEMIIMYVPTAGFYGMGILPISDGVTNGYMLTAKILYSVGTATYFVVMLAYWLSDQVGAKIGAKAKHVRKSLRSKGGDFTFTGAGAGYRKY